MKVFQFSGLSSTQFDSVMKGYRMFAQHLTYHLREGWVYKVLSAIEQEATLSHPSHIFLHATTAERLGIGTSMVRSLRWWVRTLGLVEEQKEGCRSLPRLTELGRLIYEHDPYLERLGTLWLLHYRLICARSMAPTWYWFFNHYAQVSFEYETILNALRSWAITNYPETEIAVGSLKRDVDCLLLTYLEEERKRLPDEGTSSPFARLGLLAKEPEQKVRRYRLQSPHHETLHPLILLSVLSTQCQQGGIAPCQMRLLDALHQPMSAGRTFLLTANVLLDLLAQLGRESPDCHVRVEKRTGFDILILPGYSPQEILTRYYTTPHLF